MLLLDLTVRLIFAGVFWAMIEYEVYLLSLFLVVLLFNIFVDITKYRHLLKEDYSRTESKSNVMKYIREIQASPIEIAGSSAPKLIVCRTHTEGADETSDGTVVTDYYEEMDLEGAIKVKYTGSMETEDAIKRAFRMASAKTKILAIESTFTVVVTPDLENMIVSELKRMKSKCEEVAGGDYLSQVAPKA